MPPSHDLTLCNKSFKYLKIQEEYFDRHKNVLGMRFASQLTQKAVSYFVMFFNAAAGNLEGPSVSLQYRSQ